MSTRKSILALAAEIFTALATQTQTLISELAAHDQVAAAGTARSLLSNITAGATHIADEAAVPPLSVAAKEEIP